MQNSLKTEIIVIDLRPLVDQLLYFRFNVTIRY